MKILPALPLIVWLFAGTASARPIFPAQNELSARLHPGMTKQQVTAQIGEPAREIRERRDASFVRYLAPLSDLNNEAVGYMGVEVHMVNDRVQDWTIIRGTPSFGPAAPPSRSRWSVAFWLIVLGGPLIYGTMRGFDRGVSEQSALRTAYKNRDIPTKRLPADFHFITHETTVQEVIGKLGPSSLIRHHPVTRSYRSENELSTNAQGQSVIVSFDYELPYNSAVMLLPEPPGEVGSRIQAVLYRPAKPDNEF